jgi:hypothetical protein
MTLRDIIDSKPYEIVTVFKESSIANEIIEVNPNNADIVQKFI